MRLMVSVDHMGRTGKRTGDLEASNAVVSDDRKQLVSGESPLLPSADIVVSALPGEEHLIIFVGAGLHQTVVVF